MSTKDKNSNIFSYFEKGKGEFLARSHTISLRKGITKKSEVKHNDLNPSSHLC